MQMRRLAPGKESTPILNCRKMCAAESSTDQSVSYFTWHRPSPTFFELDWTE